MLIACASATGLLLARAWRATAECGAPFAQGAALARAAALLVEGLVLAVAGAGVGVALAGLSNTALTALRLPLPVNLDLGLSLRAVICSGRSGLSS